MIRKIYKYVSDALLCRRYRRLYHRLFWFYAERYTTAEEAGFHAAEAFFDSPGMSGKNGCLMRFQSVSRWEGICLSFFPVCFQCLSC